MLILLIIMNALFGLSFTLGKIMLSHGTPLFLVAVRMITSGLVLLAYNVFILRNKHLPHRTTWALYFKQALFGIFGFYTLRAWGLQFVSSSTAATIFAFFPLSTALLSWFFRGTRYSAMQILGLFLGCFGIIFIATQGNICASTLFSCNPATIALIVSVIFLSMGIITIEELVTTHGSHPLTINSITMIVGGTFALITSLATEPVWIHGDHRTLTILLLIQSVISNCICANLQAHLLRHYSATTMSCSSFLAPMSAIMYGTLFLAEPLSWTLLGALCIIVCGILCYHFEHLNSVIQRRLSRRASSQSEQTPS
jgi:drug/metabolite transporter (DMT)-like permease